MSKQYSKNPRSFDSGIFCFIPLWAKGKVACLRNKSFEGSNPSEGTILLWRNWRDAMGLSLITPCGEHCRFESDQ